MILICFVALIVGTFSKPSKGFHEIRFPSAAELATGAGGLRRRAAAEPGWSGEVATIGLEFEFGCWRVVETVLEHTITAPKYRGPTLDHLFSSTAQVSGLPLVHFTRDMISTDGNDAELEIITGPVPYNDAAQWTLVQRMISAFFAGATAATKETWTVNGEDVTVVSLSLIQQYMAAAPQSLSVTPPSNKLFLLKKGERCTSSPQVNFGITLESFFKGSRDFSSVFLNGGASRDCYDYAVNNVPAYLAGQTTLRSSQTEDPILRAFFTLVTWSANYLASRGATPSTLDVKSVHYKNQFVVLPKAALADVARAGSEVTRTRLKRYAATLAGLTADHFASLCIAAATQAYSKDGAKWTGGTVSWRADAALCQRNLLELLRTSLLVPSDISQAEYFRARYADTDTMLGPAPLTKGTPSTVFSLAPKPLNLGTIGGKPAMVMELRRQDFDLRIEYPPFEWNRANLDTYGRIATNGVAKFRSIRKIERRMRRDLSALDMALADMHN